MLGTAASRSAFSTLRRALGIPAGSGDGRIAFRRAGGAHRISGRARAAAGGRTSLAGLGLGRRRAGASHLWPDSPCACRARTHLIVGRGSRWAANSLPMSDLSGTAVGLDNRIREFPAFGGCRAPGGRGAEPLPRVPGGAAPLRPPRARQGHAPASLRSPKAGRGPRPRSSRRPPSWQGHALPPCARRELAGATLLALALSVSWQGHALPPPAPASWQGPRPWLLALSASWHCRAPGSSCPPRAGRGHALAPRAPREPAGVSRWAEACGVWP